MCGGFDSSGFIKAAQSSAMSGANKRLRASGVNGDEFERLTGAIDPIVGASG